MIEQDPLPDIESLAREMRDGERTAVELASECLERIAELNPRYRAVLVTNAEAPAIADAMDMERANAWVRGPLHGIPVLVKDNLDTADTMPTTAGSLALDATFAERDATVVARLREAGMVLLGKTNLSEWANYRSSFSSSGWSGVGGQTRNAHDDRRTPGGSSSGSAVAVALGLCCAAVGTETDGSVVVPAAMNGVVGIKPTVGLVSRAGIVPISFTQDTAGAMARSVADASLLLRAIAGVDSRDPRTRDAPADPAALACFEPQADLSGVRLGVARSYTGYHEGLDAVFETAIERLRELGAAVVDPVPLTPREVLRPPEEIVMSVEFRHALNAYLATRPDSTSVRTLADVIDFNERNAERAMPQFGQDKLIEAEARPGLHDESYLQALSEAFRLAATDGIDAALDGHSLDAIIAPTTSPAWLVDSVLGDNRKGGCSGPAAVAGYPHVTVPMGRVAHLPVGLSLFASAWSEPTLLRIAHAFEQAAIG